jgi:hypothetical protein
MAETKQTTPEKAANIINHPVTTANHPGTCPPLPRNSNAVTKNAMAKTDAQYPAHCDVFVIRSKPPNSIIHPNPVCAIGWSKAISWGNDKASLETGQHFICNRLLQFRPGVFPIFGLPYQFWKDKVGVLNQNVPYESSFFF